MNVNSYNELEFEAGDVKEFVERADRNFIIVLASFAAYALVYFSGAFADTVSYSNILRVAGVLAILPMPILAQMTRNMRQNVEDEITYESFSSFMYVTPSVFATPTFTYLFLVFNGVLMGAMFLFGDDLSVIFISSIVLLYYIYNEYVMTTYIHSKIAE